MEETRKYMYRRLAVAVLMIFFVGTATAAANRRVNQRAEERCWETLHTYTNMLESDVRAQLESDRILLRTLANLITDQDLLDSPELPVYLKEFEHDATISIIGLLRPGDTVVFSNGEERDMGGWLSFEREAALGEHVSGKDRCVFDQVGDIIRTFVPVRQGGETVAMLYGIVELKNLPDMVDFDLYGGEAAVYLIDGETGDYLLDTWHEELGNVHDLFQREMREGYSQEQMLEDLREPRRGYVVFVSETIDEYMYYYYDPCGINRWSVAVSFPEKAVFAEAIETRTLLYWLTVFEGACFLLYFLWVIFDARREAMKKQRQIETVTYIYDVEKLLFTAHGEQESVYAALGRICQMAKAADAFFVIYGQGPGGQVFIKSTEEGSGLPALLQGNGYYQDFCREYDREKMPAGVMLIPISDADGNLIGALGVHGWKTAGLDSAQVLDSVAPSFALLYDNIRNFSRIKEMSEKDLLTDLLNRNSFEEKLGTYTGRCAASIAVVYADANGLHELNNSQGHEAGDRMLRFVAGRIKQQFGGDDTYRIGGDEFAAFALDEEEDAVREKIHAIESALDKEGYHASIGMVWEAKGAPNDIDALIKQAEQRMYEAKRQWYQLRGNDRRAR